MRSRCGSRRAEGGPTPQRSSRPAASSRCSTRSPSSAGSPGSTRPARSAIYGPLLEGTVGNAREFGMRAALTGPTTRGDAGTLGSHLATLRSHAPGVLPLYAGGRRAGDRPRARPVARWHRRDAVTMREVINSGLASPVRTGTIASHGSQHRGQVRGPTGGPFRPSVDARPRATSRACARPARSRRRGVAVDGAARPRGRVPRPSAGQLAGDPPGRHDAPPQRPAASAGGHGVGPLRSSRCGPPSGRRVGAVARLRTSTATSAGGIVVRYESGQPSLVVGQPSPRARRPDLDPPQGHAPRRREPRGDRASARSRRRPGSRSASPARSTRSSTGSSSRGRASTRPSTTS